EKVLLRLINAGAMTYFDVRIPGLKMTGVAAYGQYVHPLTVDELRIAAAETYDVIFEPSRQDAYTIFALDMCRTGLARGTLAVRHGLAAPAPVPHPRQLLTMEDMGHGGHGGGQAMEGGCGAAMMDEGSCGAEMHGGHEAHAAHAPDVVHPASESSNPLVDMQSSPSGPRLDDPG